MYIRDTRCQRTAGSSIRNIACGPLPTGVDRNLAEGAFNAALATAACDEDNGGLGSTAGGGAPVGLKRAAWALQQLVNLFVFAGSSALRDGGVGAEESKMVDRCGGWCRILCVWFTTTTPTNGVCVGRRGQVVVGCDGKWGSWYFTALVFTRADGGAVHGFLTHVCVPT